MTEYEREMLTVLCARISSEQDHAVFTQLVVELGALLERVNNHHARRTGFEGENTAT